jgi:hypothetical protein
MLAAYLLKYAVMLALQQQPVAFTDSGLLSMYHPGDGFNRGILACSKWKKPIKFTWKQNHIAYRRWWKVGCGRKVKVCAKDTGRCVMSKVMDGGPYGIIRGPLRHAVRDGRYKVWVKSTPPKGWRWRAVADLSHALWVKLGKPRGLTPIRLYFSPRQKRRKRPRRGPTVASGVAILQR